MYRLRWGSYTWVPALLSAGVIGFIVLVVSARVLGNTWHNTYFVPMLGYYVLASICQGHYFKTSPEPNWTGLWRQSISITGAVALFFSHRWLLGSAFGVPAPLVLAGQLAFIVLGFFVYGWDDTMFLGHLSKWVRINALKALFWYAVVWIAWYLIFAMRGGPISALGKFNALHLDVFIACLQWMIIIQLMIGITWKDNLPGVRFRNNYLRGFSLLVFCVGAGLVLGYLSYFIAGAMAAGVTPALTSTDKWHFVLSMATYPLIPLIAFGLYSKHFAGISSSGKRAGVRAAMVLGLSVVGYLLFRFVVSPSGVFGHHPWWNDLDLVYNFTIAILLLTHYWFNARLGFLVKVREGSAVESGFQTLGGASAILSEEGRKRMLSREELPRLLRTPQMNRSK